MSIAEVRLRSRLRLQSGIYKLCLCVPSLFWVGVGLWGEHVRLNVRMNNANLRSEI